VQHLLDSSTTVCYDEFVERVVQVALWGTRIHTELWLGNLKKTELRTVHGDKIEIICTEEDEGQWPGLVHPTTGTRGQLL
jgi:hypothetical protein